MRLRRLVGCVRASACRVRHLAGSGVGERCHRSEDRSSPRTQPLTHLVLARTAAALARRTCGSSASCDRCVARRVVASRHRGRLCRYALAGIVRAARPHRAGRSRDLTLIMKLAAAVEASAQAAQTGSRLGKRDAIAACLRAAPPEEIRIAVAYLSGETLQSKLGIGYASLNALRGEAAAAEATLTLTEVDTALEELATTSGKGSAAARAARLRALFARATSDEQDFLVRLLVGELRQGALEGVMLEAVAAAAALPVAKVRRAAMFAGDIGVVALAALKDGAERLDHFSIELDRPVQPMLAQSAVDVVDALEQLGTASFEWKVDGARVQVHKRDAQVRVFTRSLNEVTGAVPEIVEAVQALP